MTWDQVMGLAREICRSQTYSEGFCPGTQFSRRNLIRLAIKR